MSYGILGEDLTYWNFSKNGILDSTGLPGKKVVIVWQGTEGAGRQYIAAAHFLQSIGCSVCVVGPPDVHILAKNVFELAYVCTSPATRELLSRPSVVAACTANDHAGFEKAWKLECEPYTAGNIHIICQAIKGFDPNLVLVSPRLLHQVLTVGNALAIPVLLLALQEPNDVLGDAFEPAWAKMKEAALASFLSQELDQWGSCFDQALSISSPAAHFWPSVAQVKALAGRLPRFPYLALFNFELLDMKDCKTYACNTNWGIAEQPQTLPFNLNKLRDGKHKATNVFSLGCFDWAADEELCAPELYDPAEGEKVTAFIVREQEKTEVADDGKLVCVSYGPVICKDLKFMTCLVLRALKLADFSAIVTPSCGMSLDLIQGEPDEESLREYCKHRVIFVQKVPTGHFLSRCNMCLHDGNASMMRQACQMKVPCIITPIFGLQFQNAERLKLSEYTEVLDAMIKLNPEKLAEAFVAVQVDSFKRNYIVAFPAYRLGDVGQKLVQFRLKSRLQQIFNETLKGNNFLEEMEDLKQASGTGGLRCCRGRRVQP